MAVNVKLYDDDRRTFDSGFSRIPRSRSLASCSSLWSGWNACSRKKNCVISHCPVETNINGRHGTYPYSDVELVLNYHFVSLLSLDSLFRVEPNILNLLTFFRPVFPHDELIVSVVVIRYFNLCGDFIIGGGESGCEKKNSRISWWSVTFCLYSLFCFLFKILHTDVYFLWVWCDKPFK